MNMVRRVLCVLLFFAVPAGAFAQDQQLGARTKGMGGSYTAFEDDPLAIWMNPAGIATQPDSLALAYQTYVGYPVKSELLPGDIVSLSVSPESILVAPSIIPAFLGVVFQIGKGENPMAIGICVARPYHLNYALDQVTSPSQTTFSPESDVEQGFLRYRVAFAKDFKLSTTEGGGWFRHLSVGAGLDLVHEEWEFSSSTGDQSDSAAAFGGGFGLLLGLYDNMNNLKVNFGFAYQSAVHFAFSIDPKIFPAFDMPQQINVGFTFYLFEGTPLRVTLDMQFLEWSETAVKPLFSNHPEFEDVVNFSIGFEYKLKLDDGLTLYPRLGFRRFDAPWEDENDLPMTSGFKLVLDTGDEAFNIFTLGVGLGWANEGGKFRTVDIAADFGGDTSNVALGYTHEF